MSSFFYFFISRHEQDSSNDEENYADSSNTSQDSLDNECLRVETKISVSQVNDDSSDSTGTILLPQSQRQAPPDENALLTMNVEEQAFYEKFKDGSSYFRHLEK